MIRLAFSSPPPAAPKLEHPDGATFPSPGQTPEPTFGPRAPSNIDPDEAGLDKIFAVLAHTPPSDIAVGDWDDLFNAVEARLQRSAGELLTEAPESASLDAVARVQASVLECVAALDQLRTTARHELARRQQLELALFDAQAALAHARAKRPSRRMDDQARCDKPRHDSLTTLPDRGFFRDWLDGALAAAAPRRGPFAVLYLDLDGFKAINDAHGHDAGDELLRIVAARLSRTVRVDDMVSRVGGDEFACLLGGLRSREALSHTAHKLFDAVSAPVKIDDLEIVVHPSIGIATGLADATTAEALLRKANAARSRAKRRQSGHEFFDERLDVPVPSFR